MAPSSSRCSRPPSPQIHPGQASLIDQVWGGLLRFITQMRLRPEMSRASFRTLRGAPRELPSPRADRPCLGPSGRPTLRSPVRLTGWLPGIGDPQPVRVTRQSFTQVKVTRSPPCSWLERSLRIYTLSRHPKVWALLNMIQPAWVSRTLAHSEFVSQFGVSAWGQLQYGPLFSSQTVHRSEPPLAVIFFHQVTPGPATSLNSMPDGSMTPRSTCTSMRSPAGSGYRTWLQTE